MKALMRVFTPEFMVGPDARVGELPSMREADGNSLRIAMPAVAEMVSIALMAMIDTVMVGRLDGDGIAISAVGITSQPRMLVFSVFFALNIAVTAIIARKKGAGDMEAARSCLRHALMIQIFLGLIVTILAVQFARPLMLLAGANNDTIYQAASYFRITSFAILVHIMSMTICAAQRACGNTKITLKVNVTAKVVSVVLNFLLIEGRLGFPRMEVDGAAWSTVIAAVVAFILAVGSVIHRDSPLRLRRSDNWRFELPMLKSVGRLAGGGLVEQVGLRFGFFAYARVVADLGTTDFAAHLIAMQLMVLSFTFADGIGAATTALVGQNLGAKRPDLSTMYGKIGMRLAILAAAILSTTCILIRFRFPMLFAGGNQEIIATAAFLILILAVILPLQTSQLVMGGSLRGAGDTRYVAMTMIITVGIMRPLLGFLLTWPLGLGLLGAWLTIIIDQAARLIMLYGRFAGGKWKTAKV
jgi:putative MATE family efflux protein